MMNNSRLIPLALVTIALIVGVYARMHGLAVSPLAIDEYYLAQSVNNILATGVPEFECGGFYLRALLQQYVTAGLVSAGIDIHFALRIFTVIANVLALPAVFLLGRRFGGNLVASVASIVFFLSIWEIEMARFGRMYAPFQAIFVWYCVFLLDAYTGKIRSYYLAILLSFICIFVYEGAALLLVANFIPLFAGRIRNAAGWVISAAVLLFGAWFVTGGLASGEKLPDDLRADSSRAWSLPIDPPMIVANGEINSGLIATLLIGAAALSAWLLFLVLRRGSAGTRPLSGIIAIAWLLLMPLLVALGLFGVVIVITLILFIWRWVIPATLDRKAWVMLGIWAVIAVVVWAATIATGASGGIVGRIETTISSLLFYPDLYSEVLYRWLKSVPIVLLISVSSIVSCTLYLVVKREHSEESESYRFLVGLSLLMFFLVSILLQPYASLRYTLFLHPVVIVLTVASWSILARRLLASERLAALIPVTLAAVFIIASPDYSLSHIRNIATDEVVYRTEMSKWETDRVYRRWDYRSPGEFVNAHAARDDLVLTSSQAVPFYLENTTHFYTDSTGKEYLTVISCQGTAERWSGGTMVSNPEDLAAFVEDNADLGVWLILRHPQQPEAREIERLMASKYEDGIVHTSEDGRLIVVRTGNAGQ